MCKCKYCKYRCCQVPRISKNFRGKKFSYRLSQFFVYDRDVHEIYKASSHLSYRVKNFS